MAKFRFRHHVQDAVRTLQHSAVYARHLVRGNSVRGDVSWTSPGAAPVILNHGFLGTRGSMLPLTQRFQRDGRVVFSYSHGMFQLKSIRASAAELIDHLRRLERTLGISRFDMVGFSMGGLVALHAIKFMQGHRYIRRLGLLGTPTDGSWLAFAGVATLGAVSPSVWQVVPGSGFLNHLKEAPLPPGVRIRQVHASEDVFCRMPEPLPGVDPERDFVILPGGHSSLVVSRPFYTALREFFEEPPDEAELEAAKEVLGEDVVEGARDAAESGLAAP